MIECEQFAAVFTLRLSVANDPRIVTRFETYIFTARAADDAYRQAEEFVPRLEHKYRNSDGEVVTIKCFGIHNLDRVEPHGADYPGLVSSVEFLTPTGMDPSELVSERSDLSCYNNGPNRPSFPNLSQ